MIVWYIGESVFSYMFFGYKLANNVFPSQV